MEPWKTLEDEVRGISSYIWNAPARPDLINSVKVDCVVKRRRDYWVAVEISKEKTLTKLRADLSKFATIKPYLLSKGIYVECLFVCDVSLDATLVASGEGQSVEVLDINQLRNRFFDFPAYFHLRNTLPFGSAIDPVTGEKDNKKYISVKYLNDKNEDIGIDELIKMMLKGKTIILLGEYGTGKSRCIQELFSQLSQLAKSGDAFPISINLRDNWGIQNTEELIRRHFGGLGLSNVADKLLRSFNKGAVCFLLDGFDEVGSQSWGDDQAKLVGLRRKSLASINDLVTKCHGRIIIAGRAHYFNSDDEMISALGLEDKDYEIVRCKDEFTIQEMEEFLVRLGENIVLPHWLPRRPLICQTISRLDDSEIAQVFVEGGGSSEFWHKLMDVICQREARINPILDANTIKRVYQKIARVTRSKQTDVGPITIIEINHAFEVILGTPPIDESAIMLQRLPGLGRTSAESSDRSFVDHFILDGLRALDVADAVANNEEGLEKEIWSNPLHELGHHVLAQWMKNNFGIFLLRAKKSTKYYNQILAGDIVAGALQMGMRDVDFEGLALHDSHIFSLDMTNTLPSNLDIRDSIIEYLKLPTGFPTALTISSSIVSQVEGVSASAGLPPWCKELDVDRFQTIHTVARIKAADLNNSQEVFVTVIKKTFFQPGAGRKEDALIRGLGKFDKSGNTRAILNFLRSEKVLRRFKGDEGWVYAPERSMTKRMGTILAELKLSNDPIWKRISEM